LVFNHTSKLVVIIIVVVIIIIIVVVIIVIIVAVVVEEEDGIIKICASGIKIHSCGQLPSGGTGGGRVHERRGRTSLHAFIKWDIKSFERSSNKFNIVHVVRCAHVVGVGGGDIHARHGVKIRICGDVVKLEVRIIRTKEALP
jgi:hypothetical protein